MATFKLIASSLVAVGGVYADNAIVKYVGRDEVAGAELVAQLRTARDGAVIRLAPRDYGLVIVPPSSHAVPVRIYAQGARFSGLVFKGVSGLKFEGGTIVGLGGKSYGISISGSDNISITGMTITGASNGIVVAASQNIFLLSNTLTGLRTDGIDIASSRKIIVRDNSCSNFSPVMDSYDASGKLLRGGGDHPDCIQAWSRSQTSPTSDLTIERNRIEGKMQGIFLGNHVRNGVDDGGFDRVIIRNNVIRVSMYHGIAVSNARDSMVIDNKVSTFPGGFNPKRPDQPIKAWVRVVGGRTIACGNSVDDFPNSIEARPCRSKF